jgi:hypothetical protein
MVRTLETEVTEDHIGTYTIPTLELTIGGERVEFRPKGTLVVGAAGRVDIRGGRDAVTMANLRAEVAQIGHRFAERIPNRNAPGSG